MRKNTLAYLFFICCTFLATSCNDDDDTTIDEGEATVNYFPLAVQNTWNLENSSGAQETLSLSSTETVNGNTYFMSEGAVLGVVVGSDMDTALGFRKSGATYYTYVSASDFNFNGSEASIDAFEYTYFRDDMQTGESVTNNFTVDATIDISGVGETEVPVSLTIETTMIAKNDSMIINEENYENIVQLETIATASILGQELQSVTSIAFFADEVGVVFTQNNTSSYHIVSYQLY